MFSSLATERWTLGRGRENSKLQLNPTSYLLLLCSPFIRILPHFSGTKRKQDAQSPSMEC
jgi:hypothetical protein